MRAHLREHAEQIRQWVEQGVQGPKLAKLVRRTTEVSVPLRTLQRFVAEDLGVQRGKDTVWMVDPEPGVLEMDFLELGTFEEIGTGKTRKMHALLCTAGRSRHQFVWPCLGTGLDDVIEGLEAAWRFFGGVFPILLPDNLKAIVAHADRVNPSFNRSFTEYAQARGFVIDPARVRRPKDKARVERQVQYVRGNYFAGEEFRSVQEARVEAERWSREDAGMRIHGRTRQQPKVLFDELERPVLGPVPDQPYDRPTWSTHRVRKDHSVIVDYALYSVPFDLGECELRARRDRSTVKLYLGKRLVKVHPRQPRGGDSLDPKDLPPGTEALATRNASVLYERADDHGPHVGIYARRLSEGPWLFTRIRMVYRLLGLAQRFGSTATDEACARALELDVVDVSRIQGMLEKGLVRRRLLSTGPPARETDGTVLRFQRRPSEFTSGGPDASA